MTKHKLTLVSVLRDVLVHAPKSLSFQAARQNKLDKLSGVKGSKLVITALRRVSTKAQAAKIVQAASKKVA